MDQLIAKAQGVLDDVCEYLLQIDAQTYRRPLDVYSGSTIGQHTRHLLEFFKCLLAPGLADGDLIDYDARLREPALEQEPAAALALGERQRNILPGLSRDFSLRLRSAYGGAMETDTSLSRELLYVIEHAVHHLAIIRIGLAAEAPHIPLPEHFGVAASTIIYKNGQATAGKKTG